MNLDQLQQQLQEQGVQLWVDGGLLRFRAPGNRLQPALLAALQKHKKDLIQRLQPQADSAPAIVGPLTVNQQALWFLHQSAPHSPAYNVASTARIRSEVNVDAMRQAFQTLVSRHESLRTTFESRQGEPVAKVAAHGQLDFAQVDAAGWSERQLQVAAQAEYERPFCLTSGPLMRVRLFTVAPDDHVYLMVLHHIIFDAWSLWLLQDEFRTLYQQYAAGEAGVLPSSPGRYADFVRHQQQLLSSPRGQELFEYWQSRLAGDPPPLELPLDRLRPAKSAMRGASHHFRVPAELATRLKALGRAHGATPFATFLALFKLLLHKYTGQHDLVIGTTTAGRTQQQFHRVVGYFVNTLAIRSQVAEQATFADYLTQVKGRVLEALEHQEYPFPLLVERLFPNRRGSSRPLCNVMFGLQKPQQFQEVVRLYGEEESKVDWGGLDIGRFELDQQEGQFDLTCELMETGDSYHGTLKYDVELFEPETIRRMADHLLRLAEAVAADPHRAVSEYSLVDEAEQQELLALACPKRVEPPRQVLAHRLFEAQAAATPDAVAAVAGSVRWSYGELNAKANRLARQLLAAGLQPGECVPCLFEGGLNTAVALLAIWKAGGTYVPLNPSEPTARLKTILEDCDAPLVLAAPKASDEGGCAQPPARPQWLRLHDGELVSEPGSNGNGHAYVNGSVSDGNLALELSPEQTAYVIYTSGSTGAPKGVCVSHRAFCEHVASIGAEYEITAADRVLQFSNPTFDPSLEQMFTAWSVGARVVFRGGQLWTADDLWQTVASERLTVINLPPAYFIECTESISSHLNTAQNLRLVIVGGDVFPPATLEAWRMLPARLLNAYGPTESVVTATLFDVAEHQPGTRLPVGQPRANLRAYIFDRQGRLAPRGVAGELCLAGTALASGYLKDEDLTAARFVADPLVPGGRMYRTGDLARWNNRGQLEFWGRTDRQVKIRGYRIETGEVERALTSCPGLRQAAVQVVTDATGQAALAAWVVAAAARPAGDDGGALTPGGVQAYLRTRLPAYMVPQYVQIVEALPVNASGKVDFSALPLPTIHARQRTYRAPRTLVEQMLADIWARVLDVERVGIDDDFFELGGASLKSMRIAAAAAEAGLTVRDGTFRPELIFEYPTIAELAPQLALAANGQPAPAPA